MPFRIFGGYERLLHIDCSAVIFETYSTTSIKLLRQLLYLLFKQLYYIRYY